MHRRHVRHRGHRRHPGGPGDRLGQRRQSLLPGGFAQRPGLSVRPGVGRGVPGPAPSVCRPGALSPVQAHSLGGGHLHHDAHHDVPGHAPALHGVHQHCGGAPGRRGRKDGHPHRPVPPVGGGHPHRRPVRPGIQAGYLLGILGHHQREHGQGGAGIVAVQKRKVDSGRDRARPAGGRAAALKNTWKGYCFPSPDVLL